VVKIKILAFDTASNQVTVAFSDGNNIWQKNELLPRMQIEKMFPFIEDVLSKAKAKMSDIEAIAVGLGPGSFIGVRIGVVAAKTLAQFLKVPLVGVSTLDALSMQVSQPNEYIWSALDAYRQEIFFSCYKKGQTIVEAQAYKPSELCSKLKNYLPATVLGDGLVKYKDVFLEAFGDRLTIENSSNWYPRAESVLKLAAKRLENNDADDINKLEPIYGRAPDAKVQEVGSS